MSTCLTSNH